MAWIEAPEAAGPRRALSAVGPGIGTLLLVLLLFAALRGPAAHAEPGPAAAVSAGLHSQLLLHGRDVSLASAPVAVFTGHLASRGPELLLPGVFAELQAFGAVLRRGQPWQAASADTVLVRIGGELPLSRARLLVRAGTDALVYAGAWRNGGYRSGVAVLQPFAELSLWRRAWSPLVSALLDLTPDQVGWRSGLELFPGASLGGLRWEGYIGAFRPHNYARQNSGSFLEELFAGRLLESIGTLIPSDLLLGLRTLVPLGPRLLLEPSGQLLLVFLRAQNPQQIVPVLSLRLYAGSPYAIPRFRPGR